MSDFSANDASLHPNSETPCARVDSRVNRRAFLAGMGLGGAIFAISPHVRSIFEDGEGELLGCVGSFGSADPGTLHLLHVQSGNTRVLTTHPSARPAAIVRHPFRPLLYVANDVSLYQHQPRGTVETFAFDQATGKLELVGRQPLSLSATQPRSLAISPDGRSLLVAAFGGGAYNVLQIDESGLPSAPTAILKQVGRGEHETQQASSHPSYVVFHPRKGIAIAADYGAERLDILTCDDGDSGTGKMNVAARISCVCRERTLEDRDASGRRTLCCRARLTSSARSLPLRFQMKSVPIGHASLNNAPTADLFFFRKEHRFRCSIA